MHVYGFWNNKGGTGKTSLIFQALTMYAEKNPTCRVLAIDLCPQANLSELLLGGLTGKGSNSLAGLHAENPRRSVGGYFQARLPSPYAIPAIQPADFLCKPFSSNTAIASNIDLLAGDPVVELQSNAIATLSNNQIPGINTWLAVIDWISDFMKTVEGQYDTVFIDSNPSFSMYTQIALAACNRLVLPVMADDSSRRAIQNAFSLLHGIQLPSSIYAQYSFTTKLTEARRTIPKIHLIAKNRLTQYMGPASAYQSVMKSIDALLQSVLDATPDVFTFSDLKDGSVDIRDFQTTGVVAFAEGKPFSKMSPGNHLIGDQYTQVNADNIFNCNKAVSDLVRLL